MLHLRRRKSKEEVRNKKGSIIDTHTYTYNNTETSPRTDILLVSLEYQETRGVYQGKKRTSAPLRRS